MIVLRSLASGMAAMTPLPYLDDWMAATIRRHTIQRIADARRVDIDKAAVHAIADGETAPPTWRTLVSAALLPRLVGRGVKKMLVLMAATREADATLRAFGVATMFDHYCTRLHVGAGLHASDGKALRAHMDAVLRGARGRVAARLFRRALAASGRAALRAPIELVEIATGGLLRRLRGRLGGDSGETQAEEVVESAVTRAEAHGFLAKVTGAVEAGLQSAGGTYIDEIVTAFEARVRGQA
jgi:hypothetical protein